MKYLIALPLLSLATSAYSAAILPRTGTCYKCTGFTITASGGVNGVVGQLGDGQNRVYGNYPQGKYNLNCNGQITDAKGRGCILTPPTTQFQCDVGASPTPGFTIGANGQISYGGSTTFYACPTGDQGSYNIYTKSIQSKCVQVTLKANGCAAPTPPAPTPPKSPSCGYALNNFEYPHLIVPVNSASPNQAYGTQYFGEITSTISSIYNFDIPQKDAGKTCNLVFLFPQQKDLQTSSFTYSGGGNVDFAKLASPASQGTTYNNQPKVAQDYGVTKIAPGNQYTIAQFPCPGNSVVTYKLSSHDTNFKYFQDYNPSPIGLYIIAC